MADTTSAVPAWVEAAAADPALAWVGREWARMSAVPGAWYDDDVVAAVLDVWPKLFRHTEGRWAGRPFHLVPWQEAIVALLVGWKGRDGFRVYRRLLLWVGRKNGKTEFVAALSLLFFVGDGEMGGQGYAFASTEKQAKVVFDKAKVMIGLSEGLKKSVQVFKKSLFAPALWAKYEVLSGRAEGKHGMSASVIAGDEMHEWPDEGLYTTLHQSIAARDQPIELLASTAGTRGRGYGWELWEESLAIADGGLPDPSTLVVIFAAPQDADFTDESVWHLANPNLGISPKLEYLRSEAERAKDNPRRENIFRRYHLNQWTEQVVRWLPLAKWDACTADASSWRRLHNRLVGRACWGGLDLSSTRDVTAWVLVFPPIEDDPDWIILPRFFAPADTIEERTRRDRIPYDKWSKTEALIRTDGNVVDQDAVKRQILEDSAIYQIQGIGYDPWNATKLALELQSEGSPMVQVRQGIPTLGEPCKFFETLVFAGKIEHGGHPVLRWMAGNVSVKIDSNGNFKPDKSKSSEKIDGIAGTLNALVLAINDMDTTVITGGDTVVVV
jgi:phage terminase large subunit-like protein